MSTPKMNLDARLGLDKYVIDENNSHIEIDQSLCLDCEEQPCLTVCPAEVYRLLDEQVTARYENCIECGTCQIACDAIGKGGITWHPPVGGFGISYRYG